ncbi:hypothetical protein HY504_01385 [Candidatus Wolfebacteria bacterium]|nr:hypothetical protein [Candidatus Wolfebacteria bacterium]
MPWLFLAIGSYGAFALASVGDKILLTERRTKPAAYAFLVGVSGSVLFLVALALGWPIPSLAVLISSIMSGILFTAALIPYYAGIKRFEVSRIVPAAGGLTPIFLFGFLYVMVPQLTRLSLFEIIAFVLLIIGTVVISQDPRKLFSFGGLRYAVFASFLMAASVALLRYAFTMGPFWDGILWRQVGGAAFAVCLFLAVRDVRQSVLDLHPRKQQQTLHTPLFILFLLFQAVGGAGILLQNGALFLAPPRFSPFVYALQGVQYIFLFLFALLLAVRFPRLLHEHVSRASLIPKLFAIFFILIGTMLVVV